MKFKMEGYAKIFPEKNTPKGEESKCCFVMYFFGDGEVYSFVI